MTIAEANEPLSNGLKIIIAQKGLKNLYVAENAGYTPQELSDILLSSVEVSSKSPCTQERQLKL